MNIQAWFYINTYAQPPVKSWQHPLGPLASTPLQQYHEQSHKPSELGVPSQHASYGGPAPLHAPYSKPYHPHQVPMAQAEPTFHSQSFSPHNPGPPRPSAPVQPPQQAYYGQTGSPQAPGPYSNYGHGYNQAQTGHSGNQSTTPAQQQQQQPTKNETPGCFNGVIKTVLKEGFKLVKKHLMNQPDNSNTGDDQTTSSQIDDKAMELNINIYGNGALTDTNGYGDRY